MSVSSSSRTAACQTVESHQGHGERDSGVRRVQLGSDQRGVQRERNVGGHASEVDASDGVGEDESAALEDLEQRLQSVLGEVAMAGVGRQRREGGEDVVLK